MRRKIGSVWRRAIGQIYYLQTGRRAQHAKAAAAARSSDGAFDDLMQSVQRSINAIAALTADNAALREQIAERDATIRGLEAKIKKLQAGPKRR